MSAYIRIVHSTDEPTAQESCLFRETERQARESIAQIRRKYFFDVLAPSNDSLKPFGLE